MDKNSLMASLMEGGGDVPDQDLFGDIAIDDKSDPPPLADAAAADAVPPAMGDAPPPVVVPPVAPSTLQSMGASLPPEAMNHVNGETPMIAEKAASPTAPPPSMLSQSEVITSSTAAAAAVAPSLLSKSGLLGMASSDDTKGGGGGLFDDVDQEEEEKKRQEEEAERQRQLEQQARLEQQRKEEAERKRLEEEARLQQEQLRIQQQQLQQQQQQQLPVINSSPYPQQPAANSYHYGTQPPAPAPQQQHQHVPSSPYGHQSQMPYATPQQQQTSAMMQSTMMPPQQSNTPSSMPQQQQQQQQQQQHNPVNGGGFYRQHPPPEQPQQALPPGTPNNAYMGGEQQKYYYGTQQQQPQTPQQPQLLVSPTITPNPTAGMHNSLQANFGHVSKIILVKPADVAPLYTHIAVTEPMLIQQQNFLFSSTPYWSYQLTTTLAAGGTWLVRRRFSHVLKLEDKLRQACLGSILPPRPDKHATRALEEASMQQSAEFAMQRAKELEAYLNQLRLHPVAGQSEVLRLFLGLQDDIGTAWPEVSTNALTRISAEVTGITLNPNLTAASAPAHEWEENAELLTLCSSEHLRMGAVSQAVPKLEGTVSILREQGDAAGAVGMELSKVSKNNEDLKFAEVLSTGLLRHGRRTKRLALELSAAMESFLQQYKLVRYEKMAMQDRRTAIQRKAKERRGADSRAMHLAQQQRQLQSQGRFDQLGYLEQSAVHSDEHALSAVGQAEEVGGRLKSEIHRVAIERRTEWNKSMKTIASSMKEACSERLAIWESTLEAFEQQHQALGDESALPSNSNVPDPSTVHA